MQRAHFQLIADVLKGVKGFYPPVGEAQHENIAEAFADRLRSTNPNFNRSRFLEACGVQDG